LARPIRVLLVDDHPMFLDSLVRIVGRESDMTVVGTAGSIDQAVAAASSVHPDVVILDWKLSDGTGARAAEEIREHESETNIVVLTAHVDPSVVRQAIEAGCSGFLTKFDAAEEVVAAIRTAFAGEMSIPTSLMMSVLDQGPAPVRGMPSRLTSRETEVLQLLSHGYSNEALAEQLFISVHTVRNHVQSAISKLGAHSKLEAVATAAKRGIIRIGEPVDGEPISVRVPR
jgi:DNA-binding NarL/FixJ family response regulator